jgi:hypothetical protein
MAIISNAVTIADAGAFSVSLGSMVHIKTLTASASATLSFVHGTADVVLDSTYPIYKFEFINIHPAAYAMLSFNAITDGGSNYNVAKTTTTFGAYHAEDGSCRFFRLLYRYRFSTRTAVQTLFREVLQEMVMMSLHFWRNFCSHPSSTTFVKHFMSNVNSMNQE